MPRLIHLNGPPGIGKSTLARRYADDHPGVLDLDIDLVRTLIGGWQGRFTETGEIVRPVARAMAAAQLSSGRDVIMPQFLGRLEEIERFDALAREHGAAFCEITLMDDRREALARFYRDRDDDTHGVRREIRQVVTDGGGPALLASIYDQLTSVLAARPRSPSWPAPRAPSRRTTRRWPRSSRLAEPDPARPPWNFGRAA